MLWWLELWPRLCHGHVPSPPRSVCSPWWCCDWPGWCPRMATPLVQANFSRKKTFQELFANFSRSCKTIPLHTQNETSKASPAATIQAVLCPAHNLRQEYMSSSPLCCSLVALCAARRCAARCWALARICSKEGAWRASAVAFCLQQAFPAGNSKWIYSKQELEKNKQQIWMIGVISKYSGCTFIQKSVSNVGKHRDMIITISVMQLWSYHIDNTLQTYLVAIIWNI